MAETVRHVILAAGGVTKVAQAVNLTERAVYKWIQKNALPRSEYTGESDYASVIAKLNTKFSKEEILELCRPISRKRNSIF